MTRNIEAGFFFLLGLLSIIFGVFLAPSEIPSGLNEGLISSSFFPNLGVFLITVFSFVEAISVMRKKKKEDRITFWEKGTAKRALIIIFIFLLYVFVGIELFGFYLSSILLLAGVIWYLGVNRWWVIPVISIGVVLFTYFLFGVQLGLEFPESVLF